MNTSHSQRGYTLLFAVLTAVLVLGVAVFIVGVARKQYIISSTARDSFYALYAADSGIECAVQSGVVNMDPTAMTGNEIISCANNTPVPVTFSQVNDISNVPVLFHNGSTLYGRTDAAPTRTDYFGMPLTYTDSTGMNNTLSECFLLRIWRGTDKNGNVRSVIESRGYNICTGSTPAQSARTVERAILVTQ